jgi:acyl-coenzyme A thioesterase PaaI-like protein
MSVSQIKWRLFNIWGPFLGAGIRMDRVSSDYREIDVSMKLRFWNRNYLGTHYGGSLYSMTDPFYVVMLAENLGPGYVIWDKVAKIRFLRPGLGRVHARFILSPEMLEEIKTAADGGKSVEPLFTVQVFNESGEVVAEVEKTVYVRKKNN